MTTAATILIVEDGDEYLENLSRFVPGPRYLQAKGGRAALSLLESEPIDLIYLDMRFDRLAPGELLGDLDALLARSGNRKKALGTLANHQGLYILEALRDAGYGGLPVILAYDFGAEPERFARLAERHARLTWMPDAVGPGEIRARIERLLQRG
ncbi:MAG: hypothetical protein OEZ06_21650 [Myxococcales bacterium]|nr:hypothetical protein [Myxococcales bacterium]